jgi:exodeoxyribonuclease V alpha subunit
MNATANPNPRNLVVHLEREGVLRPLDAELARLVRKLDGNAGEELVLTVALASRAVADGHSCLPLGELHAMLPEDSVLVDALPPLEALRAALRASPLVGDLEDQRRELYLDVDDNLYLGRYFHYEGRVARALRRLAATAADDIDAATARACMARHFTRHATGIDWQAVAVATGLVSRLAVITGGPGTGKTTTVQWLLATLIELAQAAGAGPPRIALAAPTGKAATRLAESLRAGRERMNVDDALRDALPVEAQTLHRLLGSLPDSARFRHHAGHPLDLDVLVVDEVSMVDLPLMAKTLDALPPHARLVLLGDRDELASVEAGNVLAGICKAADSAGVSAAHAARIEALTGERVPIAEQAGPFADCVVELRDSHRFGSDSALGRLASAIRLGDADVALAVLAEEGDASLQAPSVHGVARDIVARHVDAFAALARLRDPARALAEAARLRVLTALREGPSGCVAINQAIERELRLRARRGVHEAFYPGRLLMVTENAYGVDLFNGDTGIVLDTGDGPAAWFPAADGVRSLPLAALPAHESAFAITIHKSQGSEFDRVSVVLPSEGSRILGRELLYTAVTRARQHVHVFAGEAALRLAIEHTTHRHSGLAARLLRK